MYIRLIDTKLRTGWLGTGVLLSDGAVLFSRRVSRRNLEELRAFSERGEAVCGGCLLVLWVVVLLVLVMSQMLRR